MTDDDYRNYLANLLEDWNNDVEEALQELLKHPVEFANPELPFIHFEIDHAPPYGFWEMNTQTIFDGRLNVCYETMEDAAENHGIDVDGIEYDTMVNWIADRWTSVGGQKIYSPSFAQFHYGSGVYAFDLEKRIWITEYPEKAS